MLLTGRADASTLLPLISAGTIAATGILGFLFFHERLKKCQLAAILAGFISVVCLKLYMHNFPNIVEIINNV